MSQFSGGYGIRPYGHVGAGIARPQAHCGSHRVPRAAIGRPYNAPVIRRGAFRMRPQAIYKGATHMEWTDISITVAKRDADTAEAIATMVANGGIYIEDYSDLEQQAWEIAHVDLIEQDLLDKPRDIVIVHMYLALTRTPRGAAPV